jgi:hypothetical protein
MISILCSDELHDEAHKFINAIAEAVWHEPGTFDVSSYLAATRAGLLSGARQELERLSAAATTRM